MRVQPLLLAAVSGSAAQEYYYSYTATASASVAAAQATAESSSPTSHVKGQAFDRIAVIWLENTDYDLAVGDREYPAFLIPCGLVFARGPNTHAQQIWHGSPSRASRSRIISA